jgi:acetylornithine deacetylase/succinyl-diaminopimelate desuccinylase-like protein
MTPIPVAISAALLLGLPVVRPSVKPDLDVTTARVRSLLEALVAADTENPPGSEARAVALGAARLREAKLPFEIFEFAPGRQNLVLRLKGDGSETPLLLLAHIDVVPTAGQPWTVPPHQATVKGDRIYGRGVADDLAMAAAELEVAISLATARVPLRRDVIVAWMGGEEVASDGIRWQLEHHPGTLSDAGLVLDEGGSIRIGADGKLASASLLVAQKGYQDFTIRVRGEAGHASAPRPGNAIGRLSRALDRIDRNSFPPRLVPAVRSWLVGATAGEEPWIADAMRAVARSQGAIPSEALEALAGRPAITALVRTTCVLTQVSGGTARNVLPAEASANVNCRILPGETSSDVRRALERVVADPAVEIAAFGASDDPPSESPLEGEGPAAVRAAMERQFPGVPLVPFLDNGISDGAVMRARGIPAYGIGLFPMTDEEDSAVHGPDERLRIASLREGIELLHAIVLELAARR